jgi:hypothetical protein
MRILLCLIIGVALVGCDHPVHEAGLPNGNGPANALAHP